MEVDSHKHAWFAELDTRTGPKPLLFFPLELWAFFDTVIDARGLRVDYLAMRHLGGKGGPYRDIEAASGHFLRFCRERSWLVARSSLVAQYAEGRLFRLPLRNCRESMSIGALQRDEVVSLTHNR